MHSTRNIAYERFARTIRSGETNYSGELGVVTQSLNTTDIYVKVDENLPQGTVLIDLDCRPWWRRILPGSRLPRVSYDREGNLRIYQGVMREPYGGITYKELGSDGNDVQACRWPWRDLSLTITVASNVRYANL